VLLKQEIRDTGDDAGLVAADDGDGGELLHLDTNKQKWPRIQKNSVLALVPVGPVDIRS
jgi:hypothetical protein